MNAAPALILTTAAALLIASRRRAVGVIEAPDDGMGGWTAGTWDFAALAETGETILNRLTDTGAAVADDLAARNVAAFLAMLRQAEGTHGQADPYRVTYGYRHVIQSLVDHPTVTGEWPGLVLSDTQCANAGFGPGCRSTAAGAYQIIRPTWLRVREALQLPDFGPASQDAAAVELIRRRGALTYVERGDVIEAVHRCRAEWASLPGNYAKQGQRSIEWLASAYEANGGTYA